MDFSVENHHPMSFTDRNGRLFRWHGEIYRGIFKQRARFYSELFNVGLIQTLMDKGLLIQTQVTELEFDNYGLILRHRSVPFVSYPYEWSFDMLKDAALLVIDLEMELAKRGLTLHDAHPANVLFDGCQPVWVDFCSIEPANGERSWAAFDEFCEGFLNPLLLMAHGRARIARWLLHDIDHGVLDDDLASIAGKSPARLKVARTVERLLPIAKRSVPGPLQPIMEKGFRSLRPMGFDIISLADYSRISSLGRLRRQTEGIVVLSRRAVDQESSNPRLTMEPSDSWTPKHRSVYRVLFNLRPSSVLDFGINRGWYSQLAATLCPNVVALDSDESNVAKLYHAAREHNLPILPLVMDFRNPSPGYGLCNEWLAPATQRLKCDLVLALGLMRPLVFKHRLNFPQITRGLSIFSKRWLLIEYIPQEEGIIGGQGLRTHSWYTLENLMVALETEFHSIRKLPSLPDSRVLLLCEK